MTRATRTNPYGLTTRMRANLHALLQAENNSRQLGTRIELPWGQAEALERRGLIRARDVGRHTYGASCTLTNEGRIVARWRPVIRAGEVVGRTPIPRDERVS